MGTGFLSPGYSGQGVALTTQPRSNAQVNESAVSVVPLWGFMTCTRMKLNLKVKKLNLSLHTPCRNREEVEV